MSRWIVYLEQMDHCIAIDVFHNEYDARTYCDLRNRQVGLTLYFVSLAMNSD